MPENQIHFSEQPDVSVPERVRPLLHECEKICEELKTLARQEEAGARSRAEELEAAYRAIELPPEYAEIMDKQFSEAKSEFEQELEQSEVRRTRRAGAVDALSDLLIENARFSTQVHLLPHRREFEKIRKQWKLASADIDDIEQLNERFQAACERIDNRLAQELAAAEIAHQELDKVAAALTALLEAAPEEFRKQRDALEKQRDNALVDADRQQDSVKKVLADIQTLFHDLNAKLTLHYQTLDLARWESYTLKQDLCRELETLKDTPENELPTAANRLREIRKRWQELGAVPREKQHELGPRYYEFTTHLQHRIDDYYKQLRLARGTAQETKQKLCEEAEVLMNSTEWNATGDKLKALQQQWKEAGHAGRDADKALYTRFRAACDVFFNARNAYWAEKQQQHAEGAALKHSLCDAAAKLGELPVPEAIREAKRLRAEFQKAPRAGKQEQEINGKFNAIMDAFFNGRRAAIDETRQRREALIAEMEQLDTTTLAEDKRLSELRAEWRNLPPAPRDIAAKLDARYKAVSGNLDKALSGLRQQQQQQRGALLSSAMQETAKLIEAARESVELPEIAMDLTPFPKLAGIVTDIVAGGLSEDMEKAIARNTKEFKILLDELEAAVEKNQPGSNDLAAELAAAIAQNFGSAVFTAKTADPRELLKKLLAIGMVEPAELSELMDRYEKIKDLK